MLLINTILPSDLQDEGPCQPPIHLVSPSTTRARPNNRASHRSGSRGRIFGILWTSLGAIDILVDGNFVTTVNCGAVPDRFKDLINNEALLDQLLFDSGPLQDGEHTLTVVVKEQYAPDTGCGAGIEAFDYIKGEETCSGSPQSNHSKNFFEQQLHILQDKFSEL
jgi:hypothetical protein